MPKNWKAILATGIGLVVIVAIFIGIGYYFTNKNGVGSSVSGVSKQQTAYSTDLGISAPTPEYRLAGEGNAESTRGYADNKPQPDASTQTQNRLIIKTGNVSVVVKDVNQSIKAVAVFAEKVGGFVVASNVYKSGTAPYGVVTVRIPSAVFDQGLVETKGLGEVVSEDIRGTDVTEEYVDLDSQLKNLKASEDQFLSIMKRAEKIEDILAVQNQLTAVRGQIESIQGRMKYLKQSSELSSLTVNLSTDPSVLPVVNQETNKWKPVVVVKDALRNLVELGKGLVNVLIWIIIFSPVWVVSAVIVWVVYRRIFKKDSRS